MATNTIFSREIIAHGRGVFDILLRINATANPVAQKLYSKYRTNITTWNFLPGIPITLHDEFKSILKDIASTQSHFDARLRRQPPPPYNTSDIHAIEMIARSGHLTGLHTRLRDIML